MRDEKIHGLALILGTVAMLGTGILHPTGEQLLASPEGFARHAPINVLAHSLALVGVWLTSFGIVGFARRLGLQRVDVTAALVAYGLAAVMICIAAVVDGLVLTRLGESYIGTEVVHERDLLLAFMRFCENIASSLSRLYVTAMAVALLLWSWAAWRTKFDRVLPWVGGAIAVIGLGAQLSGHLRMNVHDVMLLAAGQGVWLVWTGIVFLRQRPALPAQS